MQTWMVNALAALAMAAQSTTTAAAAYDRPGAPIRPDHVALNRHAKRARRVVLARMYAEGAPDESRKDA